MFLLYHVAGAVTFWPIVVVGGFLVVDTSAECNDPAFMLLTYLVILTQMYELISYLSCSKCSDFLKYVVRTRK